MYKKCIMLVFCIVFFEIHTSQHRTITINYRNGYPKSHGNQGGGSSSNNNCSSVVCKEIRGMSMPWTNDKFTNALVGKTDVLPGCTNVPFGTSFQPTAADYTLMALQSLNSGPNNSIITSSARVETTVDNGFVIPSDAQIAMGKVPHFKINDNDQEQVRFNKAEFNNCVERAFNGESSGWELIAFAAICKKRTEFLIQHLGTTRWSQ